MENSKATFKFTEDRKKLYEGILTNSKAALCSSNLPVLELKSSNEDLSEAKMGRDENSQIGTAKTHILGIRWKKSK